MTYLKKVEFIIVGFGISGIAAAIELKLQKRSFLVFEKNSLAGGCWLNANKHSSLQTAKHYYKFNQINYDKNVGDFPKRNEVLEYLNKSIKRFNLLDNVIYDANLVIESQQKSEYNWTITDKTTKLKYESTYLIFCGGVNQHPKNPTNINYIWNNQNHSNLHEMENSNPNKYILSNKINNNKTVVIHSNAFNDLENDYFKKKRNIVIVGNGASCCDILNFINTYPSNKCHEIKVFYRNDKFFLPKYIYGIPCYFFLTKFLLNLFEYIPVSINNLLLGLANALFIWNLFELPNSKINSTNIIASLIIQKLISKKCLSYHKETIETINIDKKIVKTDNAIWLNIDLVIFATGYHSANLKIDDKLLDLDSLWEYVIPLVKNNIFSKNLAVIGFGKSYNFPATCQNRIRWYLSFLNNKEIIDKNNTKLINTIDIWLSKNKKRKTKNNLDNLDLTYEFYEFI